MNQTKTKIILVLGESATGKTTLIEEMNKRYNYQAVQSYTTRARRSKDETGHIFVKEEDYTFLSNIKDKDDTKIYDKVGNEINTVAYTYFNGNHYWATLEQLQDKNTYYYAIDKKGIDYFKQKVENSVEYEIVYITAPIWRRIYRLIKRDGLLKGASRLINDCKMFKELEYQHQIKNIHLENSVWRLKEITEKFINRKE